MKIIAVSNSKGGVAKTVTSVHLSAALMQMGFSVLLMDVDLQHGLTSYFQIETEGLPTSLEVLLNTCPLQDAVVSLGKGLALVPATVTMEKAEYELASIPGGELRLRRAFNAAQKQGGAWDFVLIDCPSGVGFVTRNALLASDGFIIPINSSSSAIEPASNTAHLAQALSETYDREVQLLGVLLTVYYPANVVRAVELDVADIFGAAVFQTRIRRTVKVEELSVARLSAGSASKNVAGVVAEDYAALAREVTTRCGVKPKRKAKA